MKLERFLSHLDECGCEVYKTKRHADEDRGTSHYVWKKDNHQFHAAFGSKFGEVADVTVCYTSKRLGINVPEELNAVGKDIHFIDNEIIPKFLPTINRNPGSHN